MIEFKILEKIDRHCESSSERGHLVQKVNKFCDRIDNILILVIKHNTKDYKCVVYSTVLFKVLFKCNA